MVSIQQIDELWDLYALRKFDNIIENFKNVEIEKLNDNLKEIYYLSSLELKNKIKVPETNGIFKELLSAMNDYHAKNYLYCTKKLSNWILNKGFYASWILERFFEASKLSNQHNYTIKVCEHFINKGKVTTKIVQEIFYAYYYSRDYEQALKYFEIYRELFDENDLQTVGIVLIKLRRYKDAERILLSVYKKITGKEYQNNYDKYEQYYKGKYKELKEKFQSNQIQDDKELTEFAMACLFNGEYRTALQLFTQLKNKLEKAA
ncbi:MAG: hypothetical protein N2247_08095 [Leptospiraceae bacterium]|jgi:hypothetical protein|nr:hypothetical protein [Leptospiraceae bacterium]